MKITEQQLLMLYTLLTSVVQKSSGLSVLLGFNAKELYDLRKEIIGQQDDEILKEPK